MNNIQKSELNISDLKYLALNEKELNTYKLNKGDFLFNRTNSKELVGKTAIFELDGDYVFASYLIRVNLDKTKVNTYYVNYLFRSIIIRDQIDLISRQILGQANVNVDEMKDFLFPLPPLPIQEEIVTHINSIKENIKSLRKQAAELREKAKQDFENAVFIK
ncbi:restriction endonuclease subunit S [Treponema pectinovorum]